MLNKDKVQLAIAPIAWTNDDLPDLGAENTFEQCISEMALAGFGCVLYRSGLRREKGRGGLLGQLGTAIVGAVVILYVASLLKK